ncbi:hypothetical protein EIN_398230 [Entamoeba invadens IP1]|uniref:Nucleotide-diphospho-sugar transferase domain-containing protein n=1 Tax=Entamoeba invadens IP1 TaxID=370355 RepID=A0A0A1UA10_ENTIV|nr:hypothetical protein EIN_398230 [Entamoeba invadens IP1]ELP91893.1 hypothetical protein EIN_398230 [Entamoeba invadens IP1]|eukprot:XP_004258664.1 hypothetical protein EIN_398230 [Entamoeba invadens IP1]
MSVLHYVECVSLILFLIGAFFNLIILFNHRNYVDTTTSIYFKEYIPPSTLPDGPYTYPHPSYVSPELNLSSFNYEGTCGEVFKYRPNNKRDLWLTTYSFEWQWTWMRYRHDVLLSFSLAQAVIPNADRVLILMSEPPSRWFVNELENLGVIVLKRPFKRVGQSHVSQRIFAWREYLEEHKQDYDRVVISDFRDFVFFNDGFATFNESDLVFATECMEPGRRCMKFDQDANYNFMGQSFGYKAADEYKNNNSIVINMGTTFGGTQKVIAYLQTQEKYIDKALWHKWGHDQAVHNVLYYSGIYSPLNPKIEKCTQRLCFGDLKIVYDDKRKSLYTKQTGCSPVMRHKVEGGKFRLA